MAADLVRRQVTVIFAGGSVRAAKAATATIPIVFTTGEDPVKAGLVASLNRPGGNVTGITLFYVELGAKRLELLRDLVPKAELVGLLTNPRSPQGVGSNTEAEEQERDARAAASIMGRQLVVVHVSSESEIDEAFSTVVEQRAGALIVASDIFLSTRKNQLIALASRHAIPTIYPWRDAVSAGGLIGYGIDLTDSYRQAGSYIGQILQGAKPGELPVLQPTKFLLAILQDRQGARSRSACDTARPRRRGDRMKRRAFLTLLGAAAWPLAARAEQRPERVRRIGVLTTLAQDEFGKAARVLAFQQALEQLGWGAATE
jgi:putative ABC transport system substrate-binding protein